MMQASELDERKSPAVDRKHWLTLVAKTLGDMPAEAPPLQRTDDDIPIEPAPENDSSEGALVRTRPARPWSIVQRVDDPNVERAHKQALQDIEHGATGLAVVFEGAPNAFGYGLPANAVALAKALDGVPLARTHLRLDLHPKSRVSVDWLVHLLQLRKVDPARLDISFGIDPAALFAGTGRLRMSIEAMHASMPQSLAHYFALGLPGVLLEADGRVFHNAGATEAQELGAVVASAVSYLRMFEEARQPLVYAAPHIGFSLSVDQDQLVSIAKLKAVRRLWARVLETCSVDPMPATVHAETSYRMMTAKDPDTNILRNTIACFAAAAGGADTISVLPHTQAHGLPDPAARRIARNTQLVLARESRAGMAGDLSGPGVVEKLTSALCDAAWREFQAIDAEGGILRSVLDGRLQARILAARERRASQFRENVRSIVGTTLHRDERDMPVSCLDARPVPDSEEGAVFCEKLPLMRIDETLGEAA